jgi:hypothetical protein
MTGAVKYYLIRHKRALFDFLIAFETCLYQFNFELKVTPKTFMDFSGVISSF